MLRKISNYSKKPRKKICQVLFKRRFNYYKRIPKAWPWAQRLHPAVTQVKSATPYMSRGRPKIPGLVKMTTSIPKMSGKYVISRKVSSCCTLFWSSNSHLILKNGWSQCYQLWLEFCGMENLQSWKIKDWKLPFLMQF